MEENHVMDQEVLMANKQVPRKQIAIHKFVLPLIVYGVPGIHGLHAARLVGEVFKCEHEKLILMKKTVELHAPDFPRSNKTVKQELALLVLFIFARTIQL